ncbi:MAG: ABC transporter permease [Aestuariivita sp.]|nr:ABC transporter permease [Aestuariivita sp.]
MDFLNTYFNLVPVSLAQGTVYAFVGLGVMIPFRLLMLPDLTAEGSFPFGAAVAASAIAGGFGILPAMLFALLAGILAGGLTAIIHLFFKVTSLLAGIIVLTMLFSINIRVMGKPNTALFSFDTLFTALLGPAGGSPISQFAVLFVILCIICFTLLWFLHTELGLALRAVGANQVMASAQGLSTSWYVIVGIAIAGGFAATGGAIMAQYQSYADVNMGVGVLVIGLASTILGEAIVGRDTLFRQIFAPVVGAIIYFQAVALALSLGLRPSDLKLLTALFVLLALGLPILTERIRKRRSKLSQ